MGARDHPLLDRPAGRNRLPRLRRRAAMIVRTERFLRAAFPACGILLAYLAVTLFGFGSPALCLGALMLAAALLAFGWLRLHPASPHQIDRRIEAASGLFHRPLAALDDQPAGSDPLALAIWQIHQARLMAQLATARTGALRPVAAGDDPFALRILLALLLLVGSIFAGPAAPSRLATGLLLPSWPFQGPQVDAWVIPPDYAGGTPHLLNPGEAFTTLAGSRLAIVINGPRQPAPVSLNGTVFAASNLSKTSHRDDAVLTHSGRLRVGPWWHRLAAWTVTVVPPAAPVVTLRGVQFVPPAKLALSWHIVDPYGLARLTVAFHVANHPDALPLAFPLAPTTGDSGTTLDLLDSPYHGLPVYFTLTAKNLAGIAGHFDFRHFLVLPGAVLQDKTALALDRLRQNLALAPRRMLAIAEGLRPLAAAPPSRISAAADLQLAALAQSMAERQTGAAAAVAELLLLIKQIEAGPDYAPSQALARAAQALRDALQNGLHGQPPNAAVLQKLLQALNQALAQHLAALQQSTAASPAGQPFDPAALDRLAAKIAADEAAGHDAEAARELRQLQAAIQALQSAKPMTAQQAAQAEAARQAAQGLSQLSNDEAGVLDNTNQGTATPGEQQRLQQALDTIRKLLEQAKLGLPGMADAGKAMRDATAALAKGDNGAAEAAETAAIENLQKAGSALQAAAQGASIGQGGQSIPGANQSEDGVDGLPDENFVPGLGEPAANPAGAIEDRIIKQNAEPDLPAATHRYLQRLLDPN